MSSKRTAIHIPSDDFTAQVKLNLKPQDSTRAAPYAPRRLKALCFVDGQNLVRTAKQAFGHTADNFDPVALGKRVCEQQGWDFQGLRFYTGVPDPIRSPEEARFWEQKCTHMANDGAVVYTRPLQYTERDTVLPDGTVTTKVWSREKGIEIKLSLDIVELAQHGRFDVALLFSRDQDMSEIVPALRRVAALQSRNISIASAYPISEQNPFWRGIDGTQWIKLDRKTFEGCLDERDYGPSKVSMLLPRLSKIVSASHSIAA